MKSLRDYIADAIKNKTAIGHFNFATAEMLKGIIEGADQAKKPVIVGVSEGERDFFGVNQARVIVNAYREEFDVPIFLNADHTKSFEKAKEVIDADYDSIVIDGSSLPLAENLEMVKKVIFYAKEKNKDVVVEGELGFIGTSSEVLEKLPLGVPIDESKMTSPEEATNFVKETGVNLLAPAVGNVHGIIRKGGNPSLSIKRIEEIRKSAGVPLVLHGASGASEDDVKSAVMAGVAIVHYSTGLRVAFRKALAAALSDLPDEASPYKYLRHSMKAVKETVIHSINLIS
jgi:fructose-bisphosphate aldolase, class II